MLAFATLPGSAFAASSAQPTQARATAPAATAATLVGSWLYTVTILDPAGSFVFQGTETYGADGTYTEADQLAFTPGFLATPGHRGWKAAGGERGFLLTDLNLTDDSAGNATGPDKVRQRAAEPGRRPLHRVGRLH